MEPGMHGKVEIEKPNGKDMIDTLTQIRDMCDEAIKKFGCDECDEMDKGDDDEFRKMRSEGKRQGQEENGEEKPEEIMRK